MLNFIKNDEKGIGKIGHNSRANIIIIAGAI